jgi:hypothetical protein
MPDLRDRAVEKLNNLCKINPEKDIQLTVLKVNLNSIMPLPLYN